MDNMTILIIIMLIGLIGLIACFPKRKERLGKFFALLFVLPLLIILRGVFSG